MKDVRFGNECCPICGRALAGPGDVCAHARSISSAVPEIARSSGFDPEDEDSEDESPELEFDPSEFGSAGNAETGRVFERPTDWVRVHDCGNELEALTLEAELAGRGIVTRIHTFGVAGYPGVGGSTRRRWGELMVDRADSLRASLLIREFLNSLGKSDPEDGGKRV